MEQERYQQQYKAFVQQGGAAPERTVRCLSAGKSPNQPGSALQPAGRRQACARRAGAGCLPAGGRRYRQLQPTMLRRWKCCTAIP